MSRLNLEIFPISDLGRIPYLEGTLHFELFPISDLGRVPYLEGTLHFQSVFLLHYWAFGVVLRCQLLRLLAVIRLMRQPATCDFAL